MDNLADAKMEVLKSILSLFVYFGPVVAVVAWLKSATRSPLSPRSHYGVPRKDSTGPHCGLLANAPGRTVALSLRIP